jgi:2-polyprenyl-3-methyl-5-hydroxy-6-metoxy-1,4-benzoquinol methylase
MPQYHTRSTQAELMDGDIADKMELFVNLSELEKINTLTGGPQHGFNAIKNMLKNRKEEVHIVDVGFGAGDMLCYLLQNAHQLPCPIRLTGVDLMPETLAYIQQFHPEILKKVHFEIGDYKDWFAKGQTADLLTANLFCHHLSDDELIHFLRLVAQHVKIGTVINDLHRHPVAYYGIKIPTQWFSKSRFTRNDAPLSVLRGFTRKEWEDVLEKAGITHHKIQWKWAFRYLISIYGTEQV